MYHTDDDYPPCRPSKKYHFDPSENSKYGVSYEHPKHTKPAHQPSTPLYKHSSPLADHYYNKKPIHHNNDPSPPPAPISKASYHDVKFERKHNRLNDPTTSKRYNYPPHQPKYHQKYYYSTKPTYDYYYYHKEKPSEYDKKHYYVKHIYVPVNYDLLFEKPKKRVKYEKPGYSYKKMPPMPYPKPHYEPQRYEPIQSYVAIKPEYKSQPRHYISPPSYHVKDYNRVSYSHPIKKSQYKRNLFDLIKIELAKNLEKYEDEEEDDDDDENDDDDDDENEDEDDIYSEDEEDMDEEEDEDEDDDLEISDKKDDMHVKITNSNENFNLKKKIDKVNEYKSTSAKRYDDKNKKNSVPKTTKKNLYKKI